MIQQKLRNTATFLCLVVSTLSIASPKDSLKAHNVDTSAVVIFDDDPILVAMDQSWEEQRKKWLAFTADSASLNTNYFATDSIPIYTDSVYAQRLEGLNELTPMDLDYNKYVKAYINVYTSKRKDITEQVLGLSALYYPMFEEHLDKYDMPLELKHLAVVESALNPSARSRVGATGLWQFMYATGKMYGLEVNSFIDERKDPYKSTVAACEYMSYLYSIYSDWNLVLAAYNSGPGNVNKAIRRSGGKRTYWEIRRYLPRETRGYVPAFIAVNYVMNFASEHNIYPEEPFAQYPEVDTIQVCRRTTFDQIAKFTGLSLEKLEALNPSMKRNVVPNTKECYAVYLPVEAAGKFLANEDKLYDYNPDAPQAIDGYIIEDIIETHVVRSGDVLGKIAERYGVRLSSLREWNNIRGNRIYPGQRLEVHKTVKTKVGDNSSKNSSQVKNPVIPEKKSEIIAQNPKKAESQVHVIQRGDTLWDIAKLYPGISIQDIKKANSGLDTRRLKPGQKIVIPSS
ncbi:MAG: LysM peptidoglycan-binding domain-containing protein [Flavobacteriales bacterium]|nr:LysM peptidoglycan-binding domain-containing protein [Flavobacteriales bacterium]